MSGKLPVAVIGASRLAPSERPAEPLARRLGASLPAGAVVVQTGACGGYPDALAHGFRAGGGRVVGFSPARDLAEHLAGGSPADACDELRYGWGGLIEREVALIRQSQVVVALGGNVGTLSELCMAVKMERPIFIADGFPGISGRFPALLAELNVYPRPNVRVLPVETLAAAILERA